MPRRIHYIANNDLILPTVAQYFETQGYDWAKYPIKETPETDYLLIIEPLRIGAELYAISTTWKPWLMEFRPHTRLIVAAYARSQHPNCLNLLDLPSDLPAWLEKTLPVSAFPLVETKPENSGERSDFVDPWAFDLTKPGNDLNLQMRKFVIGHEESKSLFAQIAAMRKLIADMRYYQSQLENDKSDEEAQGRWQEAWEGLLKLWVYFYHRWGYYSKVFDYVPYQEAIAKIRSNVEQFKKDIEKVTASGQHIKITPLDTMIKTMKKDMMPYIFPETYW